MTKKQSDVNEKNRQQGRSHEREISAVTGMHVQAGSGCGRIKKEDLEDETHLGQAKSSRGSSIGVTVLDLEQLVVHARRAKKKPVLFVGLKTPTVLEATRDWVMIPLSEWLRWRRA